jgi:hypothetical protein
MLTVAAFVGERIGKGRRATIAAIDRVEVLVFIHLRTGEACPMFSSTDWFERHTPYRSFGRSAITIAISNGSIKNSKPALKINTGIKRTGTIKIKVSISVNRPGLLI